MAVSIGQNARTVRCGRIGRSVVRRVHCIIRAADTTVLLALTVVWKLSYARVGGFLLEVS